MDNARILRAGLALHLTVRVTGGIEYHRKGTATARTLDNGARVEEWETEKVTQNPEEHAEAIKLRAGIRNSIVRLCARTPLGDLLMVPKDSEADLDAALTAAKVIVDDHNAKASAHFLTLAAVPSRLVPEDTWTARGLRGEIMQVLADMERGIASADPKVIRDACDSVKGILPMLTEEATGLLNPAIEEGRRAAREIVRRVEKDGEDPADVVTEIQDRITAIPAARLTFPEAS